MLDPISTAFTGAVVKEATSEVARGPNQLDEGVDGWWLPPYPGSKTIGKVIVLQVFADPAAQ
jgi:hypothetical protein